MLSHHLTEMNEDEHIDMSFTYLFKNGVEPVLEIGLPSRQALDFCQQDLEPLRDGVCKLCELVISEGDCFHAEIDPTGFVVAEG